MRVGMISPPISTPWRSLLLTSRSSAGSPSPPLWEMVSIRPPIWRSTRRTPSLVGLVPTCFSRISESGVISPAARKKAAEEISPGTWIFCP